MDKKKTKKLHPILALNPIGPLALRMMWILLQGAKTNVSFVCLGFDSSAHRTEDNRKANSFGKVAHLSYLVRATHSLPPNIVGFIHATVRQNY